MNYVIGQNSIDIELLEKETFYFKSAFLKVAKYKLRCLPPVHPFGSFIARLYHNFYFLREVNGPRSSFPIRGIQPRGDFHCIDIAAGKEYYVSPEHVAGFSGNIIKIHTKIKFLPFRTFPIFFSLRRWFFSIYTGPGHVLVYTDSFFDNTLEKIIQTENIVAFDIARRFGPTTPPADGIETHISQFFSHEVNMEFIDEGKTVCLRHTHSDESGKTGNKFWGHVKHILGFFRFA